MKTPKRRQLAVGTNYQGNRKAARGWKRDDTEHIPVKELVEMGYTTLSGPYAKNEKDLFFSAVEQLGGIRYRVGKDLLGRKYIMRKKEEMLLDETQPGETK